MIPTEVQIRKELQNIIEHDLFKHSPKMIAFIQYLVDKALAGDGERLKQYTIAIELLEKPSDFDPAIDPIVRIQASKLRRALESYYLIKRKDRQVKITLPKGSYNPSFESVHPEVAQSDSVTPPIPVVAVLPFSYVGNDETIKSSFLAQSFQEELNLALARFDTLSLVSPLLVNSLPMDTVSLHEPTNY
ncbi:adenylate cyclase [Vibrio maritimus]|uniref:Adenylate cyclase n=1 Tax=Vibrio maritimus TaxID=990268 RepID=A0A090T7E3_9VIBR|nr:adenylate cyclase [Vibrio maritimus]